jgi:O-methyltransferase
MNNYFITQPPYSVSKRKNSPLINFVNKGLRFLKTGYNVQQLDTSVDMNTVEQRINYYHLLDSLIINNIPGDVIELGTFTGQCALLFQKIIELRKSDKQLHVYDTFGTSFKFKGDIEEKLKENFQKASLKLPVIHKGNFFDTLPAELPGQLCFVHIDCGFGGDPLEHKKVMMHCLESVYPRMSPGALCVLMDYNDAAENGTAHDVAPGVKLACDEFLAGKPEEIICLYGNQYLHAYFRKA